MIVHSSGFVHGDRPSGVRVAQYEGALHEVATEVLAAIDHPKEVHTVRSLDGYLVEVHAYVAVGESEMWHVFALPSEQWPRTGSEPTDSEATS